MDKKRTYFPDLTIKGFKSTDHLYIDSLSSINLIAGDNNVGKSTVLEALYALATGGEMGALLQMGCNRMNIQNPMGESFVVDKEKLLLTFFKDWQFKLGKDLIIKAGTDQALQMKLVYVLESKEKAGNAVVNKMEILDQPLENAQGGDTLERGILFTSNNNTFFSAFSTGSGMGDEFVYPKQVNFIHTSLSSKSYNLRLWDNIALTGLERHVIEALRVIDPLVENLAFLEESVLKGGRGASDRVPYITLKNRSDRYPLSIMGDGMNRILSIILGIVNSKGGICLIDEIENGIYYRRQPELWRIICLLVKELDVQLFATTHSLDCIRSFSSVAHEVDAQLIRLEKRKSEFAAVNYKSGELQIALENDIELR